jgi:hypothetical protein
LVLNSGALLCLGMPLQTLPASCPAATQSCSSRVQEMTVEY